MAIRSTEAVSSAPDQEGCGPGLGPAALRQSGVPGTGSPMRWFFSAIWLVYLIQPVSELFGHHHGVAWIAGGLAITVAFCVIYMLVLMYSDMQPRLARYGLVAIAALAALACAVYGKDWTTLWIYVSAATGLVLAAAPDGRQAATLGVAGVGACYVFLCWVSHSRARHCRIRLSGRMDELSLEVTDDGHGFPAKTRTTPGEAGCAACPNVCPPSAAAYRWARPSPARATATTAASASSRPFPRPRHGRGRP